MISKADKAILSGVGVLLTGLTGVSATFAIRLMNVDLPALASPGAIVADLEKVNGRVKTRHRETLAWSDALGRQALREGDRIRTLEGAKASIRYDDGIIVHLEPNSQITVHGVIEADGQQRVAAIQVVDGSVRAEVAANRTLAVRDAAGREQGTVRAVLGSSAAVALTAPDEIDEPIAIALLEGGGEVVNEELGARIVLQEGNTVIFPTSTATPLATPTKVAVAVATPVPPDFNGPPLGAVTLTSTDGRFRQHLPDGVVEVRIRGKKCEIYKETAQFECSLYGLVPGVQSHDVVYKHSDGRYTKQPQQIRVR